VDYTKPVRDALKEGQCWFERHGKGDHDIWFSPHTKRKITVDGKIKSRHTANEIMKQAGLSHRFR
jgi:predicted RNA binding protein YcfA (HicA-like mRNA interferase family)